MTGENRPIATPSQTVGPFFHFGLATNPALGRVAAPEVPGERVRLRIRLLDGDGLPVPDALVEIYQADASGKYPPPPKGDTHGDAAAPFSGFGRLPSDADGVCVFETIKPGRVDAVQAPHINVCLLGRGLLRQIYTRIYFAGDAGHDTDPILGLVPDDRVPTLMARRLEDVDETPEARTAAPEFPAFTWEFTVRLQGQDETVFFDL
jgi:protocatechuate 3,4-dioxygenase, alpha subunit